MEEENLQKEIEIVEMFKNPKTKTEATYRLAEHIVNKYNIITIGEKQLEMFVYQDGMYVPAENLVIDPEIQRILAYHVTKNAKSETHHKITAMTTQKREIFTSADLRYIPLKNGVFDLINKELLPHSPLYRFTYQFPIVYNKDAKCPLIESFFDQILTINQKTLIEEWIGYYFYRNYQFKKALIMVGEGDTGKTTLLEIIRYLLGTDNLSEISLHKMSSDKFSAAHLYKKHGNIVDELSANDVEDTGAFKMATGGGTITGEHKFGNQFSFHNYSKFTFACNKIPDVKDMDDEAYFFRWMIVRFENRINKDKIILDFAKKISSEEELAGLFNLAMKALSRLLEQRDFTYIKSGGETKLEMMRSGSSIAAFSSEMIEREDGAEMTKEVMYEAYSKFCTDRELGTETIKMIGTKLPYYVPYLMDTKIHVLNSKGKETTISGWRGAKIVGSIIKKDELEDYGKIEADEIKL